MKQFFEQKDRDCSASMAASIDVEKDVHGPGLLEVGISVAFPGCRRLSSAIVFNLVIKENLDIVNTGKCESNKFGCAYGPTFVFSADETRAIVTVILDGLRDNKNGILVGHTLCNDIRWLETLGVRFDGIETVDLALADRAITGASSSSSLVDISRDYGVLLDGVAHNGANDAHQTLILFEAMHDINKGRSFVL